MEVLMLIGLVLLIGTFLSGLSYALKISNVFFLIFAGMIIGIINLIPISNEFITTISELALILIVFNSTAKLHFKEVLRFSKKSFQLSFVFLFLSFITIAPAIYFLFHVEPIAAILFSVLMYGIDPAIALSVLKNKTEKVVQILEIEAILNTPITLVLSLLAFDLIKKQSEFNGIYFIHIIQQFLIPIVVGFAFGMAIVKLLEHEYFEELSYLIIITASIVTYVLSELMGGNGVLGVTVFGLIFGNHKIRHKIQLENYTSILTNTLNILVFVFLGTILVKYSQYRTYMDLVSGTGLFFLYIIVRFISVLIIGKGINLRQKIFMSLNVPKGVDVAIVIFFIIASPFSERLTVVRNISLLFILYSIVLSTITSAFTKWFFENKTSKFL